MAHKFKLQRLLDVRAILEVEKKTELGNSNKRVEKEKNELKRLEKEKTNMTEEFGMVSVAGTTAGRLKEMNEYIEYFSKAEKLQKLRIKMAEEYRETCRLEVVKASQEKKMIEKLKEIDLSKFNYEEKKREEKIVDDLVSFKETKKEDL